MVHCPPEQQSPALHLQSASEYRSLLISGEQKAQTDFDKTIIALSGGALGVTFAFAERIIGTTTQVRMAALEAAWISWVVSLASVLLSHYFSAIAMRHALKQYDAGKLPGERVGGVYDVIILVLNAFGGVAFLVGAVAAGFFILQTL